MIEWHVAPSYETFEKIDEFISRLMHFSKSQTNKSSMKDRTILKVCLEFWKISGLANVYNIWVVYSETECEFTNVN